MRFIKISQTSTMSKDNIDIVVDDVVSNDTGESAKILSKWEYFWLIKGEHPINKTLFDDEPYDIDTILTYEDHLRVDKESAPLWKKVLGFIWDPIYLPPSERRYMMKIDFFIYIYAILACFIKYLDQTNINNAYVSGMKEDLNMYGSNDYNLLTTYFNIGYLVFSIPMAQTIKYFRPSIVLPLCEILWTILVMVMAAAKNKQAIFILRLFQGILESSSFPGLSLVIGEYYGSESLGKRMFMLDGTGSISRMFAGYIQAGVYTSMNGRFGLPGWKWVFLVDGFISIPVAFLGFYSLPDYPQNSRAPWMTKKDRQFALARAKKMKKIKPEPLNIQGFAKIFISWKLWLFVAVYVFITIGMNSTSYFPLYLKSLGTYSVQQINLIPTGGYAIQFFNLFLFSAMSDWMQNRILWIYANCLVGGISNLLLSIWNIPHGLKMFAYLFGHGAVAQTILMSWFAETFYDEPSLKAINIALGNTCVYSFNAFLPLGIYKTKDAPDFPMGYKFSFAFFVIGAILSTVWWYVLKQYNQRRAKREALENPDEKSVISI